MSRLESFFYGLVLGSCFTWIAVWGMWKYHNMPEIMDLCEVLMEEKLEELEQRSKELDEQLEYYNSQ